MRQLRYLVTAQLLSLSQSVSLFLLPESVFYQVDLSVVIDGFTWLTSSLRGLLFLAAIYSQFLGMRATQTPRRASYQIRFHYIGQGGRPTGGRCHLIC